MSWIKDSIQAIIVIISTLLILFFLTLNYISKLSNPQYALLLPIIVAIASGLFGIISTIKLNKSDKIEKEILDIVKKENRGISDVAREIIKREQNRIEREKQFELLGGFLKVLEYIRKTRNFYAILMTFFIALSSSCIFLIIILANDYYVSIEFLNENKEIALGRLLAEGFLKNLKFFIYESLIITFLTYCLKKVFNYVSMIEVYKEWEIFLVMDIQRQNAEEEGERKEIVSKDFQNKFVEMLEKHEDFLMNNKNDLKLKASHDLIKEMAQIFGNKEVK